MEKKKKRNLDDDIRKSMVHENTKPEESVYNNGQTFGRPSKYDKKYCQMLLDHMEQGLSFEAFAGLLRVTKSTIYEWKKKHPDFSYAALIGVELSRLDWEKVAVDAARSPGANYNATMIKFNMMNRFPDEWREKKEIDHSGKIDWTNDKIAEYINAD